MDIGRTLQAFVLRDWRIARSYRLSWFMNIWSSVFQLLLFYYLSRIINADPIEVAPGHTVDYFAFVMVGIALYSLLTNGINVFTNSLRYEQQTGTLEVLLTLPTPPSLTMFGMATYGFIYALISTVLLLATAIILFGLRPAMSLTAVLGTTLALISSIFIFASLGIVIGAVTLVFKRAGSLVSIITQVLGLLSGVFFPVSVLPRPLQLLGEVIPLTWALNVLRQTLLVGEVPIIRVTFLVFSSLIALPAAFWVFYLALQRARQDGSVALY